MSEDRGLTCDGTVVVAVGFETALAENTPADASVVRLTATVLVGMFADETAADETASIPIPFAASAAAASAASFPIQTVVSAAVCPIPHAVGETSSSKTSRLKSSEM